MRAGRHEGLLACARCHPGRVRAPPPCGGQSRDDGRDSLLQRGLDGRGTVEDVGDHLDRQVVGGRAQAAGSDDEVVTRAQETQRRGQVLGSVTDDGHDADIDTELAKPLGQPRAVGVGDAAGEHLGAGDEDCCARTHDVMVLRRSPSCDGGGRPRRVGRRTTR